MASKNTMYTHSNLSTHKQCPKKYYHIVHERDIKPSYTKNAKAKLGDEFHKAVETCLITDNPDLPPAFDRGCFKACYAMMRKARHNLIKVTGNKIVSKPELALAIDVNFNTRNYYDKSQYRNIMFRGKIDYAVHGSSVVASHDMAYMFDIKTGNMAYSDSKQLERMAVLMFSCKPHINKIRAAYLWLSDYADGEDGVLIPERFEFNRERDYERLKKELLYDINAVHHCSTKGIWPAIQSGLCNQYCDVTNDLCEHSGRRPS